MLRDHYHELTLHFIKGKKLESVNMGFEKRKSYLLDIVVRAYDEGVAIRYHFPEATNGLFMHVTDELTSFVFAPGTKAWQEHWAQGPFHETGLTRAEWTDESERPLLLHLADGTWVALGEAALIDYPRGKFRLKADNTLQVSLYDDADLITPYSTPWRVVMAGDKAVDLINNKQLLLNLNEPAKGDFSFVRPGKAFRSDLQGDRIKASIDFAKSMNFQYVELDAGWYGPEMQVASRATEMIQRWQTTLKDITDYARSRGIGIWLYVNQRALATQLDTILPIYERLGIKGVKFGFVQVGSQGWTTWLHNAVRKCAEHHLMVDIHDEYRPTGVSRTLPNLITQEGIGGNEEMPDARHNTVLPFTRFLCGPADYTPCYFSNRIKNTHAHQLAMAVVYYSPVEFLLWYDKPQMYKGEAELQFWKDVPTTWDDSRCLDGEPGKYIVQARRSSSDWYVGVMNGLEAREVVINTALFLTKGKRYTLHLYTDDPTLKTRTNVRTEQLKVKGGQTLRLKLQPSGGAAMRFTLSR
jgi:alpha-glucosidase